MDIQVKTAKLVLGSNVTLTADEVTDYVKQQIEEAVSIFEIAPVSAVVNLYTEGSEVDPVQKCDIKLNIRGEVINQSAHSRSIRKAIDRAIPDLRRQVKRYKTHKLDKGRANAREAKHRANMNAALSYDPDME